MQQGTEYYRRKLLAKKADLLEQVADIEETGLSYPLQDTISELSSYDNHPADIGSEVFERSKDLALKDNAMVGLAKIDRALEKIEEGTYGTCDWCGTSISEERLQVEPETNLCMECRKEFEGQGNRHVRPIEEQVVTMPYGEQPGQNIYREDRVEYDGEDAWQDAAQNTDHAEHARAGSYYGGINKDEDIISEVSDLDEIPYFRGADGMLYKDVYGEDDEEAPGETVRGDRGWDEKN